MPSHFVKQKARQVKKNCHDKIAKDPPRTSYALGCQAFDDRKACSQSGI